MAHCLLCGKKGFFLKVTQNGLCHSCDRQVVSETEDLQGTINSCRRVVESSKEQLSVRLSCYDKLMDAVNHLLEFEKRGIPTVSPKPSEFISHFSGKRDQLENFCNEPKEKSNQTTTGEKGLSEADAKKRIVSVRGLTIHDDLKDLVWIGDGKYKNYKQSKGNENSFEIDGYRITISFHNQEEPSLIYTNQKIDRPRDLNSVERPSYFPTYSELTPEQKWVYLTLLSNPYNAAIDIGFVFILYYGLEKHLLSGNFKKAISIILKLRDVHKNKSFQSYSANAIVLSCMLHKRGDLVLDFIKSLDKEHELAFSDNLFLICYYSFDIPLLPKDVMRMSSTFEFNNRNYIKKYPELFLESLTEVVKNKLRSEKIDLKKYLTASEIKKVKQQEVGIFANMSIIDKSISIPLLSEKFKLKKEMYNFLETAHENVKKKFAEMRKAGETLPEKKTPTKQKKEIIFDEATIRNLEKGVAYLKPIFDNAAFYEPVFCSLPEAYYKLGDYEKAIEYGLRLYRLAEKTKKHGDAMMERFNQRADIDLIDLSPDEWEKESKAAFRYYASSLPTAPMTTVAKSYRRMAKDCKKRGEIEQAISLFEKLVNTGLATDNDKKILANLQALGQD